MGFSKFAFRPLDPLLVLGGSSNFADSSRDEYECRGLSVSLSGTLGTQAFYALLFSVIIQPNYN
jgi:hypothetical protein